MPVEIVQAVEAGPGAEAQPGGERSRRPVQEDADVAGELVGDHDVQAAVAVQVGQGDVGRDQAHVRREVRGRGEAPALTPRLPCR